MSDQEKIKFTENTFLEDIFTWVNNGGDVKSLYFESGWTLLYYACEFMNIEAIEYIIRLGCKINQQDKNGNTPLHIAIDSEIDNSVQNNVKLDFKVTRKLIDFGANLTIKNKNGKSPLDWVKDNGKLAIEIFENETGIKIS